MRQWIGALLVTLLLFGSAKAQQVHQSGNVTPGHPASWITSATIGDGGTTANGGLSGVGVKAQGDGLCQISGPTTGPYYKLCLGVSGTQGYLSFSNQNGAAQLPLNFVVNGSTVSPGGSIQVAPGQIAANYTATNPASITGNNWMAAGTSCPTYLSSYQLFANTLSAPTGTTLNIWDGSQCVSWATLNATAHTFKISATSLPIATASVVGAVSVDNSTITVNGAGQIQAVGAVAASIDAAGGTAITNGTASRVLVETAGAKVGVATPFSLLTATAPITLTDNSTTVALACTTGTGSALGCLKGDGGVTMTVTAGALSLNLSNANVWAAAQTFPQNDLLLKGSSTGTTALNSANSTGTNFTVNVPPVNDTLMTLAASQAFTGTLTVNTPGVINIATGAFQNNGFLMTLPSSGAATLLAANITGQLVSGGANLTPFTQSAGNFIVNCGNNPAQWVTGSTSAWTITAPSTDGECILQVENPGASAVIPTFSGFTQGTNTGDALTTANSAVFQISIVRIHGISHYLVSALQ